MPGTEVKSRWWPLLPLAFFAAAGMGLWHHELWRDEWQAWMLARDGESLANVFDLLWREGHFPAWHVVLFALSRLTREVVAMKVAHLAVATGSVVLLARYAPFNRTWRWLAAFGYFFAYEYAVIARPYALGGLALFLFCASYPRRHDRPWIVALSLFVLACTSIYGLILAASACGLLLLEASLVDRQGSARVKTTLARIAFGAWAGVLLWAGAIALLRPPANLAGAPGSSDLPLLSKWALASTVATVSQAYLPLPDLAAALPWGTFTLSVDSTGGLALALGVSIVLLVGAMALFARTPLVLFFFLVGTAGLLLFGHLVFGGFLRHHGHLFLLFLACVWLAHEPGAWTRRPPAADRWTGPRAAWAGPFVTTVLVVQVLSAAVLLVADVRLPFSASRQTADYIRARDLAHLPMFAAPSPPASSVSGALDRPIHYLGIGDAGTYITWNRYVRHRDQAFSMQYFRPFVDAQPGPVLVILTSEFDAWDSDLSVEELGRFGPALARTERFVLYLVRGTSRE